MLNKIFLRSKELESIFLSENRKYTSKKSRRAFKRYILEHAEAEYQKTAEPYLKDCDGNYLRLLIKLIDLLEAAQQNEVSENEAELLEMLTVACMKPRLLFPKDSWTPIKPLHNEDGLLKKESKHHWHKIKKFEDSIKKMYQKWNRFSDEATLYWHYARRGTTDLDRNNEASNDEELKDKLNNLYGAYFWELKTKGVLVKAQPTVNAALLNHCCTRMWLLPLAHIILVRDAQYQMMGKAKYKKEVLLNGKGITLDFGDIFVKQRESCTELAYYYAYRIQEILEEALPANRKSDIMQAFSDYFYKDYAANAELKLHKSVFDNINNPQKPIKFPHAKLLKRREYISLQIGKSFSSVPTFFAYRADKITLLIAQKLDLMPQQIGILRKILPELLLGTSSITTVLQGVEGIDDAQKSALTEFLSPLRTLVNPKEYFSEGSNQKEFSEKLLKAARKFQSQNDNQNSKKDDIRLIWSVYKKFIFFFDMTTIALLLSQGADVRYADCNDLPDFWAFCEGELYENLYLYRKKSWKKSIISIKEEINKDFQRSIALDSKYDDLKKELTVQISGTHNDEELTWERVKSFLNERIIPNELVAGKNLSDLYKTTFRELAQSRCDPKVKKLAQSLTQRQRQYICLEVYSPYIDRCITALQHQAMKCIAESSVRIINNRHDF